MVTVPPDAKNAAIWAWAWSAAVTVAALPIPVRKVCGFG